MNKNRDVREILRKSDWLSRRLGTRKDWKSKPRIGVYNNERKKKYSWMLKHNPEIK